MSCFRGLWSFQNERGHSPRVVVVDNPDVNGNSNTNNTNGNGNANANTTNGHPSPPAGPDHLILPNADNREDIHLFTTLAIQHHRALQLPTETLTAEMIRNFLLNLGSELAPVTAFLGGQLAQDVINVLGQREQPIQNFLMFDGEGGE